MAGKKRNTMRLDTTAIETMLKNFEKTGHDIGKIAEKALLEAGQKITADTNAAVQKPNLPRGGRYSGGDTARSIIQNPEVKWVGGVATMNVGFDFDKKGAGGFLIGGYFYTDKRTGTPKHMSKVPELDEIYKGKKYMNRIKEQMTKSVEQSIKEELEGK